MLRKIKEELDLKCNHCFAGDLPDRVAAVQASRHVAARGTAEEHYFVLILLLDLDYQDNICSNTSTRFGFENCCKTNEPN